MSDSKLSSIAILNDEPSPYDQLGRDTLLLGVSNLIINSKPPLVIGIDAKWGEGKTSFMRALKNLLKKHDRGIYGERIAHIDGDIVERFEGAFGKDIDLPTIWFNVWSVQFEKEPVIPLLDLVKAEVPKSAWDKAASSIKSMVENPKVRIIGKAALGVGELFGPGWFAALSKKSDKIFGGSSDKSVSDALANMPKIKNDLNQSFKAILETYPNKPDKMVIFIDDLDRCEPAYIVKILESLKLQLLNEHCIFVMGIATEKIKDALISQKIAADENAARFYLEKIIQLPVQLPRIWDSTLETYIKTIGGTLLNAPEEYKNNQFKFCFQLLKSFSHGNPRSLKQFFAWYALQLSMVGMIEGLGEDDKAGKLMSKKDLMLKIKLLQFDKPDAYALPDDFLKDIEPIPVDPNTIEPGSTMVKRKPYEMLAPFVGEWLKEDEDNILQLQLFLALTIDENIARLNREQVSKKRDRDVAKAFKGKWTGTFVMHGKTTQMDMEITSIDDVRFYGQSVDVDLFGRASLTGIINVADKSLWFSKMYSAEPFRIHSAEYKGVFVTPGTIEGEWSITATGSGNTVGEILQSGAFKMVKVVEQPETTIL